MALVSHWVADGALRRAAESILWKHEVMGSCGPRRCVEVGSVLPPERALLSDLRYVHLLDLARGVDATGIITLKPDGRRSVADLERPYHPLLQSKCCRQAPAAAGWTCTTLDKPVLHNPVDNTLRSPHELPVELSTAGCCMWAA